jgi:hypothetical protein
MAAAQAFTGLALSNSSDTDSGMGPNLEYGLGNPIPTQQPSFTSSFYSERTAPHLATKSPTLELKEKFEAHFEKKPLLSNYLRKLRNGHENEKAFGELFDDILNHESRGGKENGGRFSEWSRGQYKKDLEKANFDVVNPKAQEVLRNPNDQTRKNGLYHDLLVLATHMEQTLQYWKSGIGHGGRKITRNYSSRNGKKPSLRKLKQRSRKHVVSRH